MPRKPIIFNLDFMKKDIFSRFTVKQFDDVIFTITPLLNNEPYDISNMTGKIYVGVNNEMYMQDTNITVSSNSIVVTLDKNMLSNDGRAYAEIELTDSTGTVTSSSFIFDIDRKIGEGAIIPGAIEGFVEKYAKLTEEFKKQFQTYTTDLDTRFNTLTASQQQDSEVIDARKGETSLRTKIDKIDEQFNTKANQVDLEVVGSKVDLLIKTESGQTEGNVELLDIRIDNEGFEHDTAGNSVRHQTNKIIDVFEKLPNLINHATSKQGFMETNGVISDLADYKYTELIKVQSGKTIYFGSTNSNYGYVKRAIAYSDRNTVVQAKGGSDLMTWTVPEGINYARFCYMPSKYNNLTAKYDSIGDVNDYEYGYRVKYSKFDKESKTIISNSKNITDKIDIKYNLFNKNESVTLDKALSNKGVLYDAVGNFVSEFKTVKPNTKYSIEFIQYLLMFDKNENILTNQTSVDFTKKTFTTPDNCIKVRFNTKTIYKDKAILIEGEEIPYNYNTIAKILGNRVVFSDEFADKLASSVWSGVDWCSYGDSITQYENTYNWQNRVTEHFKMGTHYNRGVGGSEVAYWEGMTFEWEGQTLPRGMCMWERIKTIPQSVKLIFFMGGTNDVFRYDGSPEGDLTFNTNDTTDKAWYDYCVANSLRVGDFNIKSFKGAVASTIMKLQVWCPNALIIVGTQLSGRVKVKNNGETEYPKNNLGLSPIDYVEFTKESAQFMSTPLVDVFAETGINLFNRDKYLSDEVHPYTNEGQKLLARVVISGLKNQQPLL